MPMTNMGPLQLQLRALRATLVRQMAANSEQITRDQISELAAIETAIAAVQAEIKAEDQRLLLVRQDDHGSTS
jgi:hypothetical protein